MTSIGQAPTSADQVANELIPRVALLLRLLGRELGGELTRTEAGLLNTLASGPRRVTELAELEGVAQPTMTLLVKRLGQRGLVVRARQRHDGRVVLVSITPAGQISLDRYRAKATEVLRGYLDQLPPDRIEAMAAATRPLDELVDLLQGA